MRATAGELVAKKMISSEVNPPDYSSAEIICNRYFTICIALGPRQRVGLYSSKVTALGGDSLASSLNPSPLDT